VRAISIPLVLVLVTELGAAQPQPTEYEVKAAYLFHFASFVEWPPDVFESPDAPIVIGVLGKDPFDRVLDRTVEGKSLQRRGFVIKRGSSLRALGRLHILFISSSERSRLPQLLAALEDRSVLTVGEADGFAEVGGMVCFTLEDQRVRFEINLAAAREADLEISSQVLKLATVVHTSVGR
jgi:hypothetical protein